MRTSWLRMPWLAAFPVQVSLLRSEQCTASRKDAKARRADESLELRVQEPRDRGGSLEFRDGSRLPSLSSRLGWLELVHVLKPPMHPVSSAALRLHPTVRGSFEVRSRFVRASFELQWRSTVSPLASEGGPERAGGRGREVRRSDGPGPCVLHLTIVAVPVLKKPSITSPSNFGPTSLERGELQQAT